MKALAAPLLLLPVTSQAAQLCVERLEDNGYPNIYPVTLMQGKHEVVTLMGGDKKCVGMKAPADTVWVRWHAFDWQRPDHGLHSKHVLHSPYSITVVLKGKQQINLTVCSRLVQGENPVWHIAGDGWGPCS